MGIPGTFLEEKSASSFEVSHLFASAEEKILTGKFQIVVQTITKEKFQKILLIKRLDSKQQCGMSEH